MPIQTTYSERPAAAFAGMLYDGDYNQVQSMWNKEASAEMPFGRAVKFEGSTDDQGAKIPNAETNTIAGIVIHSQAYPSDALGDDGVLPTFGVNVLYKGKVWVIAEDAVAVGDRLWVRCTAGGTGEVVGGLTNADEGTETIDCTGQGRWLTSAAAGELAVLEVDFTAKAT